jgi:hypothetical protein
MKGCSFYDTLGKRFMPQKPLQRRSYREDVEPASLCRESTRTLTKNQEEPFALAKALTLEAAIPLE